jgi:hypothetical protein
MAVGVSGSGSSNNVPNSSDNMGGPGAVGAPPSS